MKNLLLAALLIGGTCTARPVPHPARVTMEGVVDTAGVVPPMPREARGVWVATVGNMDWPSRPGLSADSQKAELRAILDRVQALRMNLVIFQVRPMGDALYASALEPWSEFLTGTMGQAPKPFYDPLAFAIAEAHARGLELHAWFNPYRARSDVANSEIAATHIAKARPELVRRYGSQLWMDPGEKEVQEHSLRVIADVVSRYDVDGIHIDDYFYPYLEYRRGRPIDFPDDPSWRRYQQAGGTLGRADWRRHNVDQFVKRLYETVHAIKPHVKVGISPFGIWRPGHPPTVRGLDAYVELYADSRKWLNNGWLDYLVPQLYWPTHAPRQRYDELLQWWVSENTHDRHIWAGNATFRVGNGRNGWAPAMIPEQISITRDLPGASGNVHFNMSSLLRNHRGVADVIRETSYTFDALMPRSEWLDANAPDVPGIRWNGTTIEIMPPEGEQPFLYAIRMKLKSGWHSETIPAGQTRYDISRATGERPEMVGVTAVDRLGNESVAVQITLD